MRNIKLTIEYDGTRFSGWQAQNHAKRKTVQEEVTLSCRKLLGEHVNVIGASRTDAGVHAIAQAANFRTNSILPLNNIKRGLNSFLPRDISIVEAEEAPLNFHAQHDAKSKVYRYTIVNRKERSPLMNRHASLVSYSLDIKNMRLSAKCLIGKHDFKSFQAADNVERRSVRTIKRLDIIKKADIIEILVEADGFLYNMVRNIVGTLVEVGRGYIAPSGLKIILSKKDRRLAGPTAPSKGLTLVKIYY